MILHDHMNCIRNHKTRNCRSSMRRVLKPTVATRALLSAASTNASLSGGSSEFSSPATAPLSRGSTGSDFATTMLCTRRFQATAADKKFHCSVCFKSFRLEMAAKLHLQQAHTGDGSILDGAGPGPKAEPITAEPAAPVAVEEESHQRPQRRPRPTPKPLHDADQAVPDDVMQEMLAVWDRIGTSRLDTFIHSSMVMRVFAAKPTEAEDEAPAYEPAVPVPQGENPFEAAAAEPKSAAKPISAEVAEGSPFASAGEFVNPFRAAACANPFSIAKPQQMQKKEAPAKITTRQEDPQEAPKTEFGQLPKFGAPMATSSPLQAASPFAAVGVAPTSSAEQAPSPFAAAAPASSPFAAAASPFAASPFAAADSPFAAAASPFGGDDKDPQFHDYTVDDSSHFAQEVEAKPTVFQCPDCEKNFTSEFGLQSHAFAKHNGPKPSLKTKKNDEIPDLPAYVPSPVDLSVTSPFGSNTANSTSWTDLSLSVHAFSISNITLLGRVAAVEKRSKVLEVMLKTEDDETLAVHLPPMDVSAGERLCVTGSVRLNPQYDSASNRYFYEPFVDVEPPLGFASVVE